MTKFQFIRQECKDQNHQGICLTEFSFLRSNDFSEEQMIDSFLHSPHFSFESLRGVVKRNPENPFLRQAFEPKEILIGDFKKYTKEQVVNFLAEFANEDDWGNDRDDFLIIKNQFLEILTPTQSESFYVINKDWFVESDFKIREPENSVFLYYFLVLWIDCKNSTLTISEWTHD